MWIFSLAFGGGRITAASIYVLFVHLKFININNSKFNSDLGEISMWLRAGVGGRSAECVYAAAVPPNVAWWYGKQYRLKYD